MDRCFLPIVLRMTDDVIVCQSMLKITLTGWSNLSLCITSSGRVKTDNLIRSFDTVEVTCKSRGHFIITVKNYIATFLLPFESIFIPDWTLESSNVGFKFTALYMAVGRIPKTFSNSVPSLEI